MQPFHKRLQHCLEAGNLTMSDLARWFDRSPATVRSWVKDKIREPAGAPHDRQVLLAHLDQLESLIRRKKGFPVPRFTWNERKRHLAEIKEEMIFG